MKERSIYPPIFGLFRTVAPSDQPFDTPSTSSAVVDPASSNTNSPSVQRVLRDHDYSATYSTLRNDHANNANTPLAAVYNVHAYTTTQHPTGMSAGHVCDSCGRTFTRRDNLVVHVRNKRCRNFLQKRISKSQYACETCGKLFVARKSFTHHKKTGRCDVIGQPHLQKRSKLAQIVAQLGDDTVEDPKVPPLEDPSLDVVSEEVLEVIRDHWANIRTSVVRGSVQSRYNIRLNTLDTRNLKGRLLRVFDEQQDAFKVNLSYGFILRHKQTSRYRYYHASQNCCGRYLDKPSLIENRKDFDTFLQRIQQPDVLQFAIKQRPDSMWVVESVTNRIRHHPIGCSTVILSTTSLSSV